MARLCDSKKKFTFPNVAGLACGNTHVMCQRLPLDSNTLSEVLRLYLSIFSEDGESLAEDVADKLRTQNFFMLPYATIAYDPTPAR